MLKNSLDIQTYLSQLAEESPLVHPYQHDHSISQWASEAQLSIYPRKAALKQSSVLTPLEESSQQIKLPRISPNTRRLRNKSTNDRNHLKKEFPKLKHHTPVQANPLMLNVDLPSSSVEIRKSQKASQPGRRSPEDVLQLISKRLKQLEQSENPQKADTQRQSVRQRQMKFQDVEPGKKAHDNKFISVLFRRTQRKHKNEGVIQETVSKGFKPYDSKANY